MTRTAVGRFRRWWRRRELGSPSRAGRYARVEAYRAVVDFVRRSWFMGIGLPLLFGVCEIPLDLVVGPIARAIVITVGLVSGIWAYVVFVVLWSGAATQIMGASSEQSTSDVLRDAARGGWRFVNGVKFDDGWDIDHVAVGPGGVLVIETKWSGHPWPINGYGPRFQEHQLAKAARQACSNANDVQARLGLARHRVTPVAVFWSGAKRYGTGWASFRDNRTVVVHGRSFRKWLAALPVSVEPSEVERVWSSLEDITPDIADPALDAGAASIPSLRELATQWGALAPLGAAGAVLLFGVATLTHNDAAELAVPALAVLAGIWARRYRALRGLAFGWLVFAVPIFLAISGVALYVATR